MKDRYIGFLIFVTLTYFLTPSVGTCEIIKIKPAENCLNEVHVEMKVKNVMEICPTPSLEKRKIKILPLVCIDDEVNVEMEVYNTTNVMKNNQLNNDKNLEQFTIINHICGFLTARDLNHCIGVSKKFNKCITTYLETYPPFFGLIDFTKQLEQYRPEIEQIGDQEKIITIQNPNPNEATEIEFNINRDNFYFPFTLEFSKTLNLLNINNSTVSTRNFEKLFKKVKKITFNPRTKNIFFQSFLLNSINFKSISTIKFTLKSPNQDIENSVVTFKYKLEEEKAMNVFLKELKWKKRFLGVIMILFVCAYIAWFPILLLLPR